MEILLEQFDSMPYYIKLILGIVLWIISCLLAINLAFGKNSLYMYQQLIYAVGDKWAPVLFHIGWILWPIGIGTIYIGLCVVCMEREHWMEILKRIRKFSLWLLCYSIGGLGIFSLWMI